MGSPICRLSFLVGGTARPVAPTPHLPSAALNRRATKLLGEGHQLFPHLHHGSWSGDIVSQMWIPAYPMGSSSFLLPPLHTSSSLIVVLMSYLRNHSLNQGYGDLHLCFLLLSFIILALMCRSLIHFELIFIWGVR